ncbi:DUF418 domain-containing protein [Micromonospora tulbaghiae]|nr:DUF418 domain-containing protein [Micromonospora tulbaghiae]
MGIVLVNMPFLALTNAGFVPSNTQGLADRVAEFVIVAFAQGKFYLLFAFLFGYSLSLMLRRRTADGLRRFRRRLLGLAVLGIGHAVFLFIGDILITYAILGVALLWFVRRDDRIVLRGAAVAYLLGVAVLAAVVVSVANGPQGAEGSGFVADPASLDASLRGSFLDAAAGRLASLPGILGVLGALNWSFALAMFLLGLAAGRRGVLASPQKYAALWQWLLITGIGIGLPGGVLSALLTVTGHESATREALGAAVGFATAPALTGAYIALTVRWTKRPIMALVEPAGRMSLTGYLGESILLSAIFCGWGLGLFGQISAFPAALIAIGVWFALDVFASLWLARFHYGPFEWLLRAWSYAQWPPMRIRMRTSMPPDQKVDAHRNKTIDAMMASGGLRGTAPTAPERGRGGVASKAGSNDSSPGMSR